MGAIHPARGVGTTVFCRNTREGHLTSGCAGEAVPSLAHRAIAPDFVLDAERQSSICALQFFVGLAF